MLNGIYQIRLITTDLAGRSAIAGPVTVVIERNLKIGNFTLAFSDLRVPVAGIPIEIIRTYDSRDQRSNDFGVGWSLGIRNATIRKTHSLGANWGASADIIGGNYALDNGGKSRRVSVSLGNDKTYDFEAVINPMTQWPSPIDNVYVTFTNLPGTYGSLRIIGDNHPLTDGWDTPYVNFLNTADGSTFNPTLFAFTNEVGETYVIDEKLGLQSMNDRNGNTLLITTNGVIWTNVVTGGPSLGINFYLIAGVKGRFIG